MKQYQDMYVENQIMTANPAKLIAMLYDGAMDFIEKAKENINNKDYIGANENIKKAQDIIMELNLSLDVERGGEIAKNLRSLYNYFYRRLLEANVKKDIKALDEVKEFIKELADVWKEAMKKEGKNLSNLSTPSKSTFSVSG
ncbi:MAG: flagellar secretion chaperone FliS [Thermotogaceae bacterium]|jgi:flagellar protein FliS|nr:flagellar secretion chaperone FliS [Thermotogaceae bacterium]MDN5338742.1 flagellar secretion chaperone FliS [Thermotogaceae bacterium]